MRLQCVVLCILAVYIEQTCTKRSKMNLVDEDMLLFWRRSNVDRCKPFTAFRIDCNQCVCAADGTSSCTRMDCRERSTEARRRAERLNPPSQDYDTEETDESN